MKILKNEIKIDLLDRYSPWKLLFVSLVGALFIIYQNITFFSFERDYLGASKQTAMMLFFGLRYLYYTAFIWLLIRHNLRMKSPVFGKRLFQGFILTAVGYVMYVGFSKLLNPKDEWLSSLPLFQFFVMLFCVHLSVM